MKNIVFYSYPKCSTCRKASKWLDQKDFDYELIDIVKQPPSVQHLTLALKQFSKDKRRVFNTRGKSFKAIVCEINDLSDEKVIQLLLKDGKLIKRPFLVYKEKKIILGFKENEYSDQLKEC